MSFTEEVKGIAGRLYALAAELLRVVDMDETERARLIEDVKKTLQGKCCSFRARNLRQTKRIKLIAI